MLEVDAWVSAKLHSQEVSAGALHGQHDRLGCQQSWFRLRVYGFGGFGVLGFGGLGFRGLGV